MNTNQILGMAFTVLVTNLHNQTIRSMKCPVKDCPVTHHFEVTDVYHINKEEHVHVVGVNGDPVERVLESVPTRAIMVTNYFSDLNAIQRRGRVAPMPVVPKVASVLQGVTNYLFSTNLPPSQEFELIKPGEDPGDYYRRMTLALHNYYTKLRSDEWFLAREAIDKMEASTNQLHQRTVTNQPVVVQQIDTNKISIQDWSKLTNTALIIDSGGKTIATLMKDGNVIYDTNNVSAVTRAFWDQLSALSIYKLDEWDRVR